VAGPMPTNFRWLWYLVGLAGFGLMVVGLVGILGSAWDLGILIPVVVVIAIAVVAGILWFRRSLNAAVAAAPSRQGGSGAGSPGAADAGSAASSSADAPAPAAEPAPAGHPTTKPPANSGRTSRRSP
jgi:hypothetical protein